jgi:hypothetical protein
MMKLFYSRKNTFRFLASDTLFSLLLLKGVPVVNVASGSNSAFCMAVTEDGRVFSWGR